MKVVLSCIIISAVFITGLWSIIIPEEALIRQLEKTFEPAGLSVEVPVLKKGLFYNFTVRDMKIKRSGALLLTIDDLSMSINPLSILLWHLPVTFDGHISGGKIRGTVELLRSKGRTDITVDRANLEGMPFFSLIGLSGKGILNGRFKTEDGKGGMQLSLNDMRLGSGSFFGITIPFEMFYTARGALSVKGNVISVDSFSMEGKDIYARLKGNIYGNRMDLILEIMKEPAFADTYNILPLIENYRISPGYYAIPIKNSAPL